MHARAVPILILLLSISCSQAPDPGNKGGSLREPGLYALTEDSIGQAVPSVHRNLIFHMPLDEGQGDQTLDVVQGLVGEIQNAEWVEVGDRRGLKFSGNSHVRVPDNPILRMNRYEIEANIILTSEPETWSGSYQNILGKEDDYILRFWNGYDERGTGRGLGGILFGQTETGTEPGTYGGRIYHASCYLPNFNYTGEGYPDHKTSDVSFEPYRPYRINLVFDGANLVLTRDDVVISFTKIETERTHSTYDFYIGSHIGGIDGFHGIIDDVKIWELQE